MLYDKIANRWVISQFAVVGRPNNECVAVSTTNDATGTWNRYRLQSRALRQQPLRLSQAIGTWPDAYYMAMNVFNSSGTAYLGTEPFAFDRTNMLAGNPATIISPGVVGSPANNEDPLIPSDFDGMNLPPAGAPNTFLEFPDSTGNNAGHYRVPGITQSACLSARARPLRNLRVPRQRRSPSSARPRAPVFQSLDRVPATGWMALQTA